MRFDLMTGRGVLTSLVPSAPLPAAHDRQPQALPDEGGEGWKVAIVFNGSPLFRSALFDARKPSRLAEYAKGASLHLKFVITDHCH
jgi:hypothetical protein